jgi:hypothetical protein
LESGADKTNIQEAKSGKGLKIDYSEKVKEPVRAKPAKKDTSEKRAQRTKRN